MTQITRSDWLITRFDRFLRLSLSGYVRYSDSKLKNINTTSLVQEEIKTLLEERLAVVTKELSAHKSQLARLRDTLILYKSLTGEECKTVFRGRRLLRRPEDGLPSSD